jgi:WD40 repeat protein
LVAGGAEHVVHVWDAKGDGGEVEPSDPMASRTCVAASPDGSQVASLGAGTSLRVWHAESGRSAVALDDAGPLRAFAASPNGRWLAGSRDVGDGPDQWNARVRPGSKEPRATVGLWDAHTGVKVATFDGQRAPVTALVFSPDSRTLATGGFLSSDVWLWHVPSGDPALLLPAVTEACSVEALAFQPQGRLLAIAGVDWMRSGDTDGQVFLWDLAEREIVRTLPVGAAALSFPSEWAALGAGRAHAVGEHIRRHHR